MIYSCFFHGNTNSDLNSNDFGVHLDLQTITLIHTDTLQLMLYLAVPCLGASIACLYFLCPHLCPVLPQQPEQIKWHAANPQSIFFNLCKSHLTKDLDTFAANPESVQEQQGRCSLTVCTGLV